MTFELSKNGKFRSTRVSYEIRCYFIVFSNKQTLVSPTKQRVERLSSGFVLLAKPIIKQLKLLETKFTTIVHKSKRIAFTAIILC